MSLSEAEKNSNRLNKKFVIRDLENLLQRCYSNENLKMINYKATNLLPAGENYMSIIVKLDVKVRQSKSDQAEDLNIVVKMTDPGNITGSWPIGFKREIFIYAELLPVYRDIEREAGVKENDLINVLPKFIGYRNNLNYGEEIDSDSLFIMENLKVKNYYTLDKRIGMDTLHAKKSFAALARFHAMGIAMKQRHPEFALRAIEHAQLKFVEDEFWEDWIDSARRIFKECTHLSKYLDKFECSIKCFLEKKYEEPWVTINHADFWINSIMFHKDVKGNIDDVKLIDFQTYEYGSPLQDIACFIGFNLDEATLNNHVDELYQIYYETLVDTLKRVGCDMKLFTKESFEKELKKQLLAGFTWSVVSIQFFVYDTPDEDKDSRNLPNEALASETSQACKERLYKLVEFYESNNWFL